MKKNVIVEKRISNKEGAKEYVLMYIDFGYTELAISFDIAKIAQFADLKPSTIAALKVGQKLVVATFELKGV
jgi:hypothetical protein